jgi:hypothetical protein
MGLKTMFSVNEWNKKIYRNADGSFVKGDKITTTELWESFKIKSAPKFRDACWSEIPVRWTKNVRIMLGKISEEFGDTVTIEQIKEKWCNLTVYFHLCSSIDDKDKATKRIQELIKECKENLIYEGVHPPSNA